MSNWVVAHIPDKFATTLRNYQAYRKGNLIVFVGERQSMIALEDFRADAGTHLAIHHRLRFPTWPEISEARYQYLPSDRFVYQVFPPKGGRFAMLPDCFHLWMPQKSSIIIV